MIVTSGRRKRAIARAVIKEGTGKIFVNHKGYMTLGMFDRLKIEEPVRIAKEILGHTNFDVEIKMKGGGEKSQIEAARLSLARAIVEISKSAELKKAYVEYDRSLLVADVRRKETYKPGDSKARRRRQKSYR